MKTKYLIILVTLLMIAPMATASVTLKWKSTPETILGYDPAVSADTTGDGVQDALFIAGRAYGTDDTLHCIRLNAATGQEVWRRSFTDADGANHLNPIELYDVTGDGVPEVFTHWGAPTGGYQIGFICLDGTDGSTVWEQRDNRVRPAWHHFIILADKETNIPYIIFNSHPRVDSGSFYMMKLDARTGAFVKEVTSGGTCNGGVSAADIDNDGDVELFIGLHSPPGFVCYDDELNLLWSAGVDTQSSTQCVTLVDVTGPTVGTPDGILDCVSLVQTSSGATSGGITVVDGSTHGIVPSMSAWNLGFGFAAHGQGSVADFDLDGKYEITSAYDSPSVIIRIADPPELVKTMSVLGDNAGGGVFFQDVTGDDHYELHYYNFYEWDTYNKITGSYAEHWNGMLNDVDGDGLAEMWGPRNGQITCYDTDKPVKDGINTHTAHYGYRRMASSTVYEPCPGTYWYSWAEWEANQQIPDDVICWRCENGEAVSETFPPGTDCTTTLYPESLQPTCGMKTCYDCDNGYPVSQEYPEGTDCVDTPYKFSSPQDCSQPDVIFWRCFEGEAISQELPFGTACPEGWQETKPLTCITTPGFELPLLLMGLIGLMFYVKRRKI